MHDTPPNLEVRLGLPNFVLPQVGGTLEDIKVGVHIFLVVLVFGTLWRMTSYHLIASNNPHLNHLGLGMSQQY